MKFDDLNLSQEILKAVEKNGFLEPTPIQLKCIPEIKKGNDIVGQSLTGSGKTAAFGLPILERVKYGEGIQALVLTPTRELTNQVKESLVSFSTFIRINITEVFGGVSMLPQFHALKRAEVVVATPGRLLDHIRRGSIDLRRVNTLVLDEADKMLDMGFIDDVEEIIRNLPKERQTMLFSATIPMEINRMIDRYLKNPRRIKEQLHVSQDLLKQVYYDVKPYDKFSLLVYLLKKKTPGLAIVFCGTRREVDQISRNLKMQGINAMAVHGGLSQNKRSYAVDSIKKENIQVLVATDIAARGLDIKHISHVYNYDSPKNSSEYTHRIGRTARAGEYGEAVTILAERDYDNFRNVMSDSTLHIEKGEVPEFQRVGFVRDEGRRNFPNRRRFNNYRR